MYKSFFNTLIQLSSMKNFT